MGFAKRGFAVAALAKLATLYLNTAGDVAMRTWTDADDALLANLIFARPNGVPLIEGGVTGSWVTSLGGGIWPGDAEATLRTLRVGAGMRAVEGQQFLI